MPPKPKKPLAPPRARGNAQTITRSEIKQNGFPKTPMLIDAIQEYGETRQIPEVRVWCHGPGGDAYKVFQTFKEAMKFIESKEGKKRHCEPNPLIAFRGFEINLWGLPELLTPTKAVEKIADDFVKSVTKKKSMS